MSPSLIRNIWAVGRNYAAHAAEMKAEAPSTPFFFLKAGACLETGSKLQLPEWSKDVHHELEIAYWLDENLNFSHVGLALDLTARDAQSLAKSKGLPWSLAKSFKSACPLSPWIGLHEIPSAEDLSFSLHKNNQLAQQGHISQTIFKPSELLSYLKKHFPVGPYDVVLTGTPEGVGPLRSGDSLEAALQSEGHTILTCHWDVI
jgi:2-keto-4-pentenoate hydratase/2-oxohepta-3-ene-1,7-dioic acid hydratase in catechol pathway